MTGVQVLFGRYSELMFVSAHKMGLRTFFKVKHKCSNEVHYEQFVFLHLDTNSIGVSPAALVSSVGSLTLISRYFCVWQLISYTGGSKYVHGNPALTKGLGFTANDPSTGDASLSIALLSPAQSATYQCKVKKSPGVDTLKVSLVVMGKSGLGD